MGVSLIYLGINDGDGEMAEMCKSIVMKLGNIECQETNLNTKALPKPTEVRYEEVWFCGHSRFRLEGWSIRALKDRNLGGFPISEIAKFVKECVIKGKIKFRFICCEAAQQQREIPEIGNPPEGFEQILGNEFLKPLTEQHLTDFARNVNARISHVEGVIHEMAELWKSDAREQKSFTICGLWGAGDVTRDDDQPITSFLQDGGALQSANTIDAKFRTGKGKNPNGVQRAEETFAKKKEKAKQNFADGHCSKQQLPDFFGFEVGFGLLKPQPQPQPQSQPKWLGEWAARKSAYNPT